MTAAATATWLAAGLGVGLRHATDPDHVAAIASLIQRRRSTRGAVATAAAWGAGHSVSFLAVGTTILATGARPPPTLDLVIEVAIGLMLVALGLDQLRALRRPAAAPAAAPRAFAVGVLHGVAGSGAIALVVMTSIRSTAAAIGYLVTFALGVVVGMAVLTTVLALPVVWSAQRERYRRYVVGGAALAGVAAGSAILLAALRGP